MMFSTEITLQKHPANVTTKNKAFQIPDFQIEKQYMRNGLFWDNPPQNIVKLVVSASSILRGNNNGLDSKPPASISISGGATESTVLTRFGVLAIHADVRGRDTASSSASAPPDEDESAVLPLCKLKVTDAPVRGRAYDMMWFMIPEIEAPVRGRDIETPVRGRICDMSWVTIPEIVVVTSSRITVRSPDMPSSIRTRQARHHNDAYVHIVCVCVCVCVWSIMCVLYVYDNHVCVFVSFTTACM